MNYSIQKYIKGKLKPSLVEFENTQLQEKLQQAKKIIRRTKYKKYAESEDVIANVVTSLWIADTEWRPEWNISLDSNRLKFAEWELSKSTKTKSLAPLPAGITYQTVPDKSIDIDTMLAALGDHDPLGLRAIELKLIENRSVTEIAEKLKKSESSVYELISKSRKFLRLKFPEYRKPV